MEQNQDLISAADLAESILRRRRPIEVCGVSGSERAYLLSVVQSRQPMPMLVVTASAEEGLRWVDELRCFGHGQGLPVLYFPAYHLMPFKFLAYHNQTASERIRVLYRLMTEPGPWMVVTSIQALLQRLVPRQALSRYAELLQEGEEIDRERLVAKLIAGGYLRTAIVEEPGDFSVRGGIVDVFSPLYTDPLRIEFCGDVPVNIHRSNVMWYNPAVLAEAGVEVPTTMDEFFAACEKIDAAGKICLGLGPQWTAMHLLENIMVGSLGADKWNALWNPGADWASADVTAALDNCAKALTYVNSDHTAMTDWQPATKLVTDGDAAFNIMGDWADGYLENPPEDGLGLKAHEEFDWAPAPGTDGIFVCLSDSFVMPANAKRPDATTAWLTVAASKAGREAFNPVKGSIWRTPTAISH